MNSYIRTFLSIVYCMGAFFLGCFGISCLNHFLFGYFLKFEGKFAPFLTRLLGYNNSMKIYHIPYIYIPVQSQIQLWLFAVSYIILAVGILFCIPLSIKLFNRARLYANRTKELGLSDIPVPFPYVLYLRSFDALSADSRFIENASQTEEEIHVNSLSPIGNTVSIGCPYNPIPPLGGYRMYVSDDEWQNAVEQLSKDAKLTALRIGGTESFSWEIECALVNISDLQKLIFLIPDIEKTNLAFFAKLENAIRKYRPNDIQITPCYFNKQGWGTVSSIIYFEKKENESDNKPTYIMKQSLVPRRTIWNCFGNLSSAFQKAMFPVYKQFGRLNFKKKFCNAFVTYPVYILLLIVFIGSIFVSQVLKTEQPITSADYTQAVRETEQKYPKFAMIIAQKSHEHQRGFMIYNGHLGCKFLSDEHLLEFSSLETQVYKSFYNNKDYRFGFDAYIAQLPQRVASKYNNYMLHSAFMALNLEEPECSSIVSLEDFKNRLSEARSSLTEEQYETVNNFITSCAEYTWDQFFDYMDFINKLPDNSLKALLIRGAYICFTQT